MFADQIYFLTSKKTYVQETDCQIGNYTITYLPMTVSDSWKKKLPGGNRWMKKLFRFFYLRKLVKGKDCVVVGDDLKDVLPKDIYYQNMEDNFPKEVFWSYARMSLEEIVPPLRESGQVLDFLVILPEDGTDLELMNAILEVAQEMESVYFWSYSLNEKDWIEDKFEILLNESGVAGMCYFLEDENYENPFRIAGKRVKPNDYVILLDFSDRPLCQLWGLDYYIDGCGEKTRKEIKILTGRRTRVKALRNYLDRAFCARLY